MHDGTGPLPDRWSTRGGPHHIKAAAALLRLPAGLLDDDLVDTCRATVDHWEAALLESWPVRELHPLLYGIEGLLILERRDAAEQVYERLMQSQAPDGTLPAMVDGSGGVRSDVLAQALRAGALLPSWSTRLDALAEALLHHVQADGGVRFSLDQGVSNAWCAMFTHQALLLHSRAKSGALDGREAAYLI